MLAVTGGKGGVGKTTTTLGVARAAARAGRAPVVVDADLDMPNLATMAGVSPGGLRAVAAAGALSTAPAVDGVTVLGAESGATPEQLRRVLDDLAETSRPVFVDCPAGTSRPHGLALRAAQQAVVVTRLRRDALADAVTAATLARRLAATPAVTVVNETDVLPGSLRTFGLPEFVTVEASDTRPPWTADADGYRRLQKLA